MKSKSPKVTFQNKTELQMHTETYICHYGFIVWYHIQLFINTVSNVRQCSYLQASHHDNRKPSRHTPHLSERGAAELHRCRTDTVWLGIREHCLTHRMACFHQNTIKGRLENRIGFICIRILCLCHALEQVVLLSFSARNTQKGNERPIL